MRDQPPTTSEVRELVRRIVDATLAVDATRAGEATLAVDATRAGEATLAGDTTASTGTREAAAAPALAREAIAIGGDHGGYRLKDAIGRVLTEAGFGVRDCGTNSPAAVDYPDIAHAVARLVADGECRWGIIVDGAGIGSCMVANKVPGVRAALCHDLSSARNSREHNHANVLTLGSGFIGEGLAIEIVRAWLGTAWAPGRHAARVEKISEIERRYMREPGEGRAG